MYIANLNIYKQLSNFRSQKLARKVADQLQDNTHVLDFGCGNMYTANSISEIKPTIKITGVDVVKDQNLSVEILQNANLEFVLSEAHILPFEDEVFDHTLALAMLHHTDDPEHFLNELKRVTKPGGTIILAEEMFSHKLDALYIKGSDFILNKLKTGIPVPLNFRSRRQYLATIQELALNIIVDDSLRLPPNWMHHYFMVLQK